MSTTLDTKVDGGKTSGATSLQWNHTVTAGLTNAGLVVPWDMGAAAAASPSSVVWDSGGANTALTLQGVATESAANCRTGHHGLIAPASGTKAVKVTFASSVEITAGSLSVQYADQTNLFRSASNSNTGTSATTTALSVATATGDLVVSSVVINESGGVNDTATQSFGTLIHQEEVGAGTHSGASAYITATGTTQSVQWTLGTATDKWAQLGSSIKWDGTGPSGGTTIFERRTYGSVGRVGTRRAA